MIMVKDFVVEYGEGLGSALLGDLMMKFSFDNVFRMLLATIILRFTSHLTV